MSMVVDEADLDLLNASGGSAGGGAGGRGVKRSAPDSILPLGGGGPGLRPPGKRRRGPLPSDASYSRLLFTPPSSPYPSDPFPAPLSPIPPPPPPHTMDAVPRLPYEHPPPPPPNSMAPSPAVFTPPVGGVTPPAMLGGPCSPPPSPAAIQMGPSTAPHNGDEHLHISGEGHQECLIICFILLIMFFCKK